MPWKVPSYLATWLPVSIVDGTFLTFGTRIRQFFDYLKWGNPPECNRILRYVFEAQLETKKGDTKLISENESPLFSGDCGWVGQFSPLNETQDIEKVVGRVVR